MDTATPFQANTDTSISISGHPGIDVNNTNIIKATLEFDKDTTDNKMYVTKVTINTNNPEKPQRIYNSDTGHTILNITGGKSKKTKTGKNKRRGKNSKTKKSKK